MMFTWIIILGVIVLAAIFLGKGRFPIVKKKEDAAIDTLKRRFANGEIDEDEYEERKAVLEEDEEDFTYKP